MAFDPDAPHSSAVEIRASWTPRHLVISAALYQGGRDRQAWQQARHLRCYVLSGVDPKQRLQAVKKAIGSKLVAHLIHDDPQRIRVLVVSDPGTQRAVSRRWRGEEK